ASRPARPAAHVGRAGDIGPGPLAMVYALRARMAETGAGVACATPGAQPAAPAWLSPTWVLGLAVRFASPALLAPWLTGGVQQVLGWIAVPPPVASPPAARGAHAGALRAILDCIAIEPVIGAETSSYGYRRDPFTNRRKLHKG